MGLTDRTLLVVNFGIYLLKILYTNVTSCVAKNGYASEFFPIENGIRQRCPSCALLFMLAVEILAINI